MAHTTECTHIKSCTVTKHGKLALFAQLCYRGNGFKYNNKQKLRTLLRNSISYRVGEKGSNYIPTRLTGRFGRAVALAGVMLVTPLGACAQDNTNPDTPSIPQHTITMVADAGSNTVSVVPSNTDGQARIYNVAAIASKPPVQTASLNVSTQQILPDAHTPADTWAVAHPDGVAISLRLGTDRSIPLETIEQVLTNDFTRQGIEKIAFFYEAGDIPATGVAFHTDDYVYGPFSLITARKAVPKTASQMQFNNEMNLRP